MNKVITRPCGVLHLKRDDNEKNIFYVYRTEGKNIPDMCGQLNGERDFLIIKFEVIDYEVILSLYTTNQDAIGIETGELYRGEELLKIARLTITPELRGATRYEDYALLLDFNVMHDRLSIRFYDEHGSHASCLLTTWNYGLLEDKVA